jgi:glucose/arabinose dehydrogenase
LPLKQEKRAIEGHMAGGRLAFAPPDTLVLASGDYNLDGVYGPGAAAQDPSMDYGKVIEINLGTGAATIVSSGHRNMQGISFDHDGKLWVVEHGMRGGDEINHVVAGENYGWPKETLGTLYNKMPWPSGHSYGRHEQFRSPTFAWLPSVAPSGLTLIDGFHETWDRDLLMSTLRLQSLYRIRIEDERVKFAERIFVGKRIRYVQQHSDGRIVLWTDDHEMIFLTIDEEGFITEFIDDHFDEAGYSVTARQNIQDALESCMQCHSFDPGDHVNAPSLGRIFNAPIAGLEFAVSGYVWAVSGGGADSKLLNR